MASARQLLELGADLAAGVGWGGSPFALLGGQGNVSVTANVAPRLMHELCMAAIEGDVKRATALHLRLLPLHLLGLQPPSAPWRLLQPRGRASQMNFLAEYFHEKPNTNT